MKKSDMLKTGKRIPPHIHARMQLLKRIADLSAKGIDRLPPERELCTDFGVSFNTVKKAIRQLVLEGRIASVLRKGHFIRAVPVETNIGVIIGEGSSSAHLGEPEVLSGILDELSRHNCTIRMILPPKPLDAPHIFNQYRIDGCIWYLPHHLLFPKIAKVMRNCRIPIVVPIVLYSDTASFKLPENHFTNDFTGTGRVRTEYLIRRGHRNILYCASVNTEPYDGFLSALKSVGAAHNHEWSLPKLSDISKRLPAILDAGEVTAIICDGGRERIESVFRVLEKHPWSSKGELLVDFIGGGFAELHAKYPKVKVTAVNYYPSKEIGRRAAAALVDTVKDGNPLHSEEFVSQVRPPDWLPQ